MILVKRILKTVRGFGIELLLTFAVAWIGRRWIVGFDIRGPFLMISPIFAAGIFFLIGLFKFNKDRSPHLDPKNADSKLIKETALEFNLGHVTVFQQEIGAEVNLILSTHKDIEASLPKNWNELTIDAKRFAVVRVLVKLNRSGFEHYLKHWPYKLMQVGAMFGAGMNLWLILFFQGLFAGWFAHSIFFQRAKTLIEDDLNALKVMRNLQAAIAFVKLDPMNKSLSVEPEQRIGALKHSAHSFGLV